MKHLIFAVIFLLSCKLSAKTETWLALGQSNMAGRGYIDQFAESSIRNVAMYFNNAWRIAKEPTALNSGHSLLLPFAKYRHIKTGYGQRLINAAVGATTLKQWHDRYLDEAFKIVDRSRAKPDGILWWQGEGEFGGNVNTYKDSFYGLAKRIRNRYGNVPILYAQLEGSIPQEYPIDPRRDQRWNNKQESMRLIELQLSNSRMIVTHDSFLQDAHHVNTEGLKRIGRRFAMATLGARGPRYAGARWIDRNTIKVHLSYVKAIYPVSNLRGFEVNGYHPYASRVSGDWITLQFKEDIYCPANIRYAYGRQPIANVTNEYGLPLPAMGYQAICR